MRRMKPAENSRRAATLVFLKSFASKSPVLWRNWICFLHDALEKWGPFADLWHPDRFEKGVDCHVDHLIVGINFWHLIGPLWKDSVSFLQPTYFCQTSNKQLSDPTITGCGRLFGDDTPWQAAAPEQNNNDNNVQTILSQYSLFSCNCSLSWTNVGSSYLR